MKRRFAAFALSSVAVCCLNPEFASATIYTWQPTSGGLFNIPANWSPAGPPATTADTAVYPSTATQTIIFESDVTVGSHRIENGNVTFQLNQTTQTMSNGAGLIVGNTANLTGRVTIVNGKLTGDMSIGNADASTGLFT